VSERSRYRVERDHYTEMEKLNWTRISELDDEINERDAYVETLKSNQNGNLAKDAIDLIGSENIRDKASISLYRTAIENEKSLIESYKKKMMEV
jgi:hypothetical protein